MRDVKGANGYTKWHADMVDLLTKEEKEETVFDKRKKNKGVMTIFEQRKRGGK